MIFVIIILQVTIITSLLVYFGTFNQKTTSEQYSEQYTSSSATHGLSHLHIGSDPVSVAYNPASGKTYVADGTSISVSVIDSDNKIIRTVKLGIQPTSMVVDPSTNSVIVGGSSSDGKGAIVMIGGQSDVVAVTINTPAPIAVVAYDKDNKDIYAATSASLGVNGNQSTILVIDTLTESISSQIVVNGSVSDIIYDGASHELYVSATAHAGNVTGTVTIIDTLTNEITANVEVGIAPEGLVLADGKIYVANSGSSSVSVIDSSSNTVVETIPDEIDPVDLAFDSTNKAIYVTDKSSGELSVIDTTSLSFEGVIDVGSTPASIAYDSTNNELYVTNEVNLSVSGSANEGLVTVIPVQDIPNLGADISISDQQTSSGTEVALKADVPVGGAPTAIVYDPSNNMIYTTDSASDTVSAIDAASDKVITNIPVGIEPTAIVYDSVNSNTYVADTGSNNIVEISTEDNSIVATIDVGLKPSGIAFDQANRELYVSNSGSDTVSVIDTNSNTVVATIDVGINPTSIAYDPINGEVYVANSGTTEKSSNIVSVIDTATNEVVKNIPVGSDPTFVTVDTNNGEVFVSAQAGTIVNGTVAVPSNNVAEVPVSAHSDIYVIDPSNNDVVAEVNVGGSVDSMTFDPAANEVVAVIPESNSMLLIDAGTDLVSQTVTFSGETPTAVAYDQRDNTIITASYNTDVVSVMTVTTTSLT